MSSGNLVEVTFVKETVYDTTPVNSPDWETARWKSESLNSQPEVGTSEEVRADRMIGDQFKTRVESGGGFEFEFSADSFDTLLDGAMMKAVAAGIWKIGTDDISYTLTKQFTDLTANHFFHYSGMRVGEMSLSFVNGEPLTGSFTFGGASIATASASLVGTGTLAPATTTRVMNAVSDVTNIEVGGVGFSGCIQEITLNINNNLRPTSCIGSDTPSDQLLGTAEITGTIKAYLTDVTVQWYTDKVLNQAAFDLKFSVTDGSSTYEFDLPNCRLNAPSPASGGLNNDVMIEADFVALYDATNATSLMITKT